MLTSWQAKKAREEEWLVAARLLSHELERLLWDLATMLREAGVPSRFITAQYVDTSLWEEHRATIARSLPNNLHDSEADEFWRQLCRLFLHAQVRAAASRETGGRN